MHEDRDQEEREFELRLERVRQAREAIVASLGSWTRGVHAAGRINCPICGLVHGLHFRRAGSNGHIGARCETQGCVAWME
jgi:hypothetical protein